MSMEIAGIISPRVIANYDATQPYDRLNIVFVNNISYIARTAVPANTAITNTTYWMPLSVSPYVTSLDASAITSGVLDIARIPAASFERIVHVANQAARFALTPSDVQLGDTVQQDDTGAMYIVVDLSALDSGLGYNEYSAGNAATVNGHTVNSDVPANATFISRTAASGGTDLSLVTTGEKYEWNAKQSSYVINVTLAAASWSGNTYTVTNSNISATCNGYLGLSASATATQRAACRGAMIVITAQSAGSLTLTADGTVPSIDIPIDIILFN